MEIIDKVMHYDYYFCIVTEKNIANYLPFKSNRFNLNSSEIILLISDKMKNKYIRIEELLKNKHTVIKSRFKNSYDFQDILEKEINNEKYKNKNILFNITGGPTSFTLKAFLAGFKANNLSNLHFMIIDQDDNSKVEKLDSSGDNIEVISNIKYKLEIKDYLYLYYVNVLNKKTELDKYQVKFINSIIGDNSYNTIKIKNLIDFFHFINCQCYYDINDPKRNENFIALNKFKFKSEKIPLYKEYLELLYNNGLILSIPTEEDCTLFFKNEESHKFCTGGWLEIYVYKILEQLKKENNTIYELEINLNINYTDSHNEPNNELDIVFTANTRLYAIECKTGNQMREKFNEIIDKTAHLTNKLQVKTKIITSTSWKEIERKNQIKNDKNKLFERNQIIDADDLHITKLKKIITDWIE